MKRARTVESGRLEAKRISPVKRFFLQPYSSSVTACVLLLLMFSVFTESFLSAFNLFNLSRTVANYGFIAAAQLMVVVIGGMNLSVGAVGALATVVSGLLMQNLQMGSFWVIVITTGVGALCGLLNGVLISRLKLAPFVITLAMSFVYDGIATGISHGYSYAINEGFSAVGRGRLMGTSMLFVLLVVLVLLLVVMFRYTIFGRNVLATGGNVSAARLSGIKVDRVVVLCNILSCALAAVSSMLWTSKIGTASPTTGSDWMLFSFAVCAVGGISLAGGNFTAIGFFCGACILTMVRNGLTMMHVDIYFEETFIGAVILIAVSIESLRSRVARNLIT